MCKFQSADGNGNRILFGILLSLGLCSTSASQEERSWTSHDGAFKTKGTIISATEERVQLRRSDNNKIVVVNLDRLTLNDQKYVKDYIAKTQKQASKQPTNEEPSSVPKMESAIPTGNDLRLEKIDDKWLSFFPYGPVPVPETGFEWKIVGTSPPRIVAAKQTLDNALNFDVEIAIEILPPTDQNGKLALVKSKNDNVSKRMKEKKLGPIISSIESIEKSTDEIKVRAGFDVEGWQSSAVGAGYRCDILFLSDKTIVMEAFCQGNSRENRERAFRMGLALHDAIASKAEWYPKSGIPPEIKQDLAKSIKELLELVGQEKYAEMFEKILPSEEFQQLKSNPDQFKGAIEQFKTRKSIEFVQPLQNLDWDIARYDATDDSVTFPASARPMTFKRIMGRWTMR